VPPFVVTLGGMSVFRGAALLFADGGPISGFDPEFVWWGQARIGGQVPVPVIIFLACAILAHVVLRYTRYGRQVYAVGGNPEAARLSGLNVRSHQRLRHHGLLLRPGAFVARPASPRPSHVWLAGDRARRLVGGTSLFGGTGSIFGTVVGTVLTGVLLNGLQLNNASTSSRSSSA
jgi:ribose/xylose/arabinose/galactoside ABC-type transport system permease subunit